MRRWTVAIATLALLTALAATSTASGAGQVSASAACAGAHKSSTDISRLRRVVFCLHNAERRQRGLRALRSRRSLSRAARKHARDMVRRHYFDHMSPGGSSPFERISATGYGGGGSFSNGENILWFGPADSKTPQGVIQMWMDSAGHRHNILRPGWHDLGIGVASGSPDGGSGRVVVAEFATRSR